MDTKSADEKIREAFEAWFSTQGLGAHQHDTLLEAWLRGALSALEIDREDMSLVHDEFTAWHEAKHAVDDSMLKARAHAKSLFEGRAI